ncbi:MAG TPA: enoyl-CoA hydratase/isomerase family protein [Gemmatimonadaceae bacterium]|nr:enoyl-CoA hydratase/isomerase family protein [Gemmatimonadaceae bacterium]
MPGIHYESRGKVGVITLHRPEALNAMSRRMVSDLLAILETTESDTELRVLVITGTGRSFSSGIDLKEMGTRDAITEAEQRQELNELQELTRRIVAHPKIVIAAINGIAVGIGAELAIACDLRIAAETATLRFPEVKLGLFHTNGLMYLLPRLVGAARATRWLLSGETISAAELRAAGVVSQLVPADVVLSVALSWANELAANAPLSMELAKRLLRRSSELSLDQTLDEEIENVIRCSKTVEAREALRAFRERDAGRGTGDALRPKG